MTAHQAFENRQYGAKTARCPIRNVVSSFIERWGLDHGRTPSAQQKPSYPRGPSHGRYNSGDHGPIAQQQVRRKLKWLVARVAIKLREGPWVSTLDHDRTCRREVSQRLRLLRSRSLVATRLDRAAFMLSSNRSTTTIYE